MPRCKTSTAGCFSGKEGPGVCLHEGQRPGVSVVRKGVVSASIKDNSRVFQW